MDTVNLNETAKVKHILSLAQAINAKLDGDGSAFDTSAFEPVDPRADNTITLGDDGQTSPNITMTQLQAGFSVKINTTNGTPYISWVAMNVSASIYESGVTPYVQVKSMGNPTAGKACTIVVDGDDNYKPATLDITLTN